MSRDPDSRRKKPVPSSAKELERKHGYREETPIAFETDLASEPCVEARTLGLIGANHYCTPLNPPYYVSIPGSIPDLFLRKTVATKLSEINMRLAPLGVELWLFDAWRPQAIQRYFHDVWFPEWLKQRNPSLNGQALVDEVEKYWAAPTAGRNSPSPHSTGGAVDLTLVFRETRQPLYMGGIFDDLTPTAWTDGYEHGEPASMSDEEARANRRLLYWVMTEAGFANNPTEWWHYSWGDQLWARLMRQPAAHYGGCIPEGVLDP
jgi:zinc D-Ala-D-Ala dipeptidase